MSGIVAVRKPCTGRHSADIDRVLHRPAARLDHLSVLRGNVAGMTTSRPTRRQLTATCPEDLLAFVPIAIGFAPTTSVVLLGIEGTRPFHARIDLPDDESDVEDVVDALLRPARLHGITKVVFVVYDEDTAVADESAWALLESFRAAGIEVFEVLRVHDGCYYAVLPGRSPEAYSGIPYEVGHHPFVVESVFGGRVTHASREALAATLASDVVAVQAVADHLDDAEPLPRTGLRSVITGHAASRFPIPPAVIAGLVRALAQAEVRDQAWRWLTRDSARSYVEFWSDVVRRTPEELVPGPASVLALTAWLAGDGALAWCAVDRAREVEPRHSLAGLVAEMLTSATSPELWDEVAHRGGQSAEGAA